MLRAFLDKARVELLEFTYDDCEFGKTFPGEAARSCVGCSTMYLDSSS